MGAYCRIILLNTLALLSAGLAIQPSWVDNTARSIFVTTACMMFGATILIAIWAVSHMNVDINRLEPTCHHDLEFHRPDGGCWYEFQINLPWRLRLWRWWNIPDHKVESYPVPHVTLLYGIKCSDWALVDRMVDEARIECDDITFAKTPRKGAVSEVWFVDIISPKLETLFWELHKAFPNKHYLHHGKFEPHVTLCTTKS